MVATYSGIAATWTKECPTPGNSNHHHHHLQLKANLQDITVWWFFTHQAQGGSRGNCLQLPTMHHLHSRGHVLEDAAGGYINNQGRGHPAMHVRGAFGVGVLNQ